MPAPYGREAAIPKSPIRAWNDATATRPDLALRPSRPGDSKSTPPQGRQPPRIADEICNSEAGGENGPPAPRLRRPHSCRSLRLARLAEAREGSRRASEGGGESGIRTHGRVSPTHAF